MIAEPTAAAVHLRALDPFDFLERAAFVYPDKTAVVDGAARRTYPEFLERVERLSASLLLYDDELEPLVSRLASAVPRIRAAEYEALLAAADRAALVPRSGGEDE